MVKPNTLLTLRGFNYYYDFFFGIYPNFIRKFDINVMSYVFKF